MENLLLSTSGEWGQMLLTIFCIFGFLIFVALIYTSATEKSKVDKDTAGCLWPLVIAVSIAIVLGLINCKGCSTGSKSGGGGDYWDNYPRHTKIEKVSQNNVNMLILS